MTPATNTLKRQVLKLRLSGLLGSLELSLQEAGSHRLPYAEFLELISEDELNVRNQRLTTRRNKVAALRETRSLENFGLQGAPGGGIFSDGVKDNLARRGVDEGKQPSRGRCYGRFQQVLGLGDGNSGNTGREFALRRAIHPD